MPFADGTACELQPIVRRCRAGHSEKALAGGQGFVADNGAFRQQRAQHRGDGIRGDGAAVWNRGRLIGRPRGRARCPDRLGKRGECPAGKINVAT
jgi:hypothetical protein